MEKSFLIIAFIATSMLILPNIPAYQAGQITNITTDYDVVAPDQTVAVKIYLKNTGSETTLFYVGLTIGYNLAPNALHFNSNISCDTHCYSDGLGAYAQILLDPDGEGYITRQFTFKSDTFSAPTNLDIETAIYNQTFMGVDQSFDHHGFFTYFYLSPLNYPYHSRSTCDTGWGNNGTRTDCSINSVTIPQYCPDKHITYKAYARYNYTDQSYGSDFNRFGYWNVNLTGATINYTIYYFPQDMFDAQVTDLSSIANENEIYDIHSWSIPNSFQNARSYIQSDVYCNIIKNVTIEPNVMSLDMAYEAQYSIVFRIRNNGTIPAGLTVTASDYRWMCIKDQNNTYHTSSFNIYLTAGAYYDIALSWSPAGDGLCSLTGLPTSESGAVKTTFLTASNATLGINSVSTQFINLGTAIPPQNQTQFTNTTPLATISTGLPAEVAWVDFLFTPAIVISVLAFGIAGTVSSKIGGENKGAIFAIASLIVFIVLGITGVLPKWIIIVAVMIGGYIAYSKFKGEK